jgi:hypothetical protein
VEDTSRANVSLPRADIVGKTVQIKGYVPLMPKKLNSFPSLVIKSFIFETTDIILSVFYSQTFPI